MEEVVGLHKADDSVYPYDRLYDRTRILYGVYEFNICASGIGDIYLRAVRCGDFG